MVKAMMGCEMRDEIKTIAVQGQLRGYQVDVSSKNEKKKSERRQVVYYEILELSPRRGSFQLRRGLG